MTSTEHRDTLNERLRTVRVAVRKDCTVTRHVFRGVPCYAIREPMSLESFQLDVREYAIFCHIDDGLALGEIFEALVREELLNESDETVFYEFVLGLHRSNILSLPLADDRLLYRRNVARNKAKRRKRFMGLLFYRIPLTNPDAFLTRTYPVVRALFHPASVALWCIVVALAGVLAWRHGDQLGQSMNGVLSGGNLPLLWCALVILKIIHELGHAYSCKHFGGEVPEMGMLLILLTPAAYVDASTCWTFPRKRDRIIVCLAGMYVELFCAAVALFVWIAAAPGLTRDVAYNVMVLASVVTVLFNINPLMRFDGYYVLSDLLEIPNLRSRSTAYVAYVFKRYVLGVQATTAEHPARLKATLGLFGVLATTYRLFVVGVICSLIALELKYVGLIIAGTMLTGMATRSLVRAGRFVCFSQETAGVRGRAVTAAVCCAVVVLLAAVVIPLPVPVIAAGTVQTEHRELVRAVVAGQVEHVAVRPGDPLGAQGMMVRLANSAVVAARDQAASSAGHVEMLADMYAAHDAVSAEQYRMRAAAAQADVRYKQEQVNHLAVRCARGGRVAWCIDASDAGAFVKQGDPVGLVSHGQWIVRAMVTAEQLADAVPGVGQAVIVRPRHTPDVTLSGRIRRILPVGTRTVDHEVLTHLGGGPIAVDAATHEAGIPYIELEVVLEESAGVVEGMRCSVEIETKHQPLATLAHHTLQRFIDRVLQD